MITAVIVAAGQGSRMGADLRKQYMQLAGHPILARTVLVFDRCVQIDRLVLVVPENEIDFCRRRIIDPIHPVKPVMYAAGGSCRQDSVYNGLQAITDPKGVVLIHDGVRPFISAALIEACIAGARRFRACIPALSVFDSLKKVNSEGFIERTISREAIYVAQTPQAFSLRLIKKAHEQARGKKLQATDDATLIERQGHAVWVIPGLRENIKITTPEDLRWAEMIISAHPEMDGPLWCPSKFGRD
jgi:2-C-methyl-D-erythritol 4-phosphate cytidylyltransferase